MKLKRLLIKLIDFYKFYLAPHNITTCVFLPSCSEYTRKALEKYGAAKGLYLGARRILRCHPWQSKRIDPLR